MVNDKSYSQALAKSETLLADYPDDSRVNMARGAVLAGQSNYPGACAAFFKATELSPGSMPAVMNLAEIEFVLSHYPEAVALHRKLLTAQPNNALLIFRLYLCARMQKDPEVAEKLLRNPYVGTQSLEWYYMQAADALFSGQQIEGLKKIQKARVLFGSSTVPFDNTFVRLGLITEAQKNQAKTP